MISADLQVQLIRAADQTIDNFDQLNTRLLFGFRRKDGYMKNVSSYSPAPISNSGDLTGLTCAYVFLPAADTPSFAGNGDIDLGITGQDMIIEAKMIGHRSPSSQD
ncbi:hypothetical protein DFH29DRAFT_875562 [Suillus ampliporus]|nr:hypothetical protein DFH29DRAFT_875562 [Suillus ampliporus]